MTSDINQPPSPPAYVLGLEGGEDQMEHEEVENIQTGESVQEEQKGDDVENVQGTSMKRKGIKKRSGAWDHFKKYLDDSGNERSQCNYCEKNYDADPIRNGISSMISHIRVYKNNPQNKKNKVHTTLDSFCSSTLGGSELGSFHNLKVSQEEFRKSLARMLVKCELPFAFVESEGFTEFMSVVCPHIVVPSRTTVTRDVLDLYIEQRNSLKSMFAKSKQRISLTTNTWTSNSKINYMSLTGHYIDEDWKFRKLILNFVPCGSHRGDDIGMLVEKCLQEWGLDDIFSITVDNASSNDTAVAYLRRRCIAWKKVFLHGKYLHVRCVAHIVNLVVRDGSKEVSQSVERIHVAVKYIRKSSSRFKKFKTFAEEEKVQSKKILCLDVSTRWNSVFFMLETDVIYKDVFERYSMSDVEFQKDFGDGGHFGVLGEPTKIDWEVAKRLVCVLHCFYELTLKVSGSKYVTSNGFLDELANVDDAIKNWMLSDDRELAAIATRMKAKFDKYWGDPMNMNLLLFVLLVLDPRRKLKYVFLIIEDINGSELGGSICEMVKKTLYDMFDEYKKLYGPNESQGSSSSQSEKRARTNVAKSYLNRLSRFYGEDNEMLGESELDSYLNEKLVKDNVEVEFNILKWWKGKSEEPFPILSRMARDLLVMPISTVASECAFSTGGRVIDDFRSSLAPKTVQALICLQDWIRNGPPILVEEDYHQNLLARLQIQD